MLTHNKDCLLPDPDAVAARASYWEKFQKWATSDDAAALRLGYDKKLTANSQGFNSRNQSIFSNGKNFITRDVDGHNVSNGWKMFDRKGRRMGTFDELLIYVKE